MISSGARVLVRKSLVEIRDGELAGGPARVFGLFLSHNVFDNSLLNGDG